MIKFEISLFIIFKGLLAAKNCLRPESVPLIKVPNVIFIFTKDDLTICNNCCPISLLSNTIKIIQKLILARLTTLLNKHNTLYERQFGFCT